MYFFRFFSITSYHKILNIVPCAIYIYTHTHSRSCCLSPLDLKKKYLFLYFWLRWVFVAAQAFFLVMVSELLIVVVSLVAEHGL